MKFFSLKICLLFSFFLLTATSWGQAKLITGKIISAEDGKPLSGVSILLKGRSGGTQTNANGEYSIEASANDVLIASYSGFLPKEINVDNATTHNISLKAGVDKLDEVVVVGYGTKSRRNVTSSIAKLDKEVLASAPRGNIGSALQGSISGLQVINATGQPGASPQILLRGGASINSPGSPLVVV
ncbi:MAG: carboxypeptidase-like regulatory domain-containing protein, partial [Ginsengibacter sp.]